MVGIGQDQTGDEVIDRASEKKARLNGPSLSPLHAFIALMSLAVVAGAVVVAVSNPDSPGDALDSGAPSGGESPRQAPSVSAAPGEAVSVLSEGEALALFSLLRRKLEGAYRRRSVEALLGAIAHGSPQYSQSRSDLRFLQRNNLLDRTRSRTLEVSIVAIEPDRVVVTERSAVRPRYVDDATHVEVDLQLAPTRSRSEWTLEKRIERWVITSSRATG